MPGTL